MPVHDGSPLWVPSRRRFIRGALALAASAAVGPALLRGQPRDAVSAPRRIDFHHHYVPPRHLEAVLSQRESGRTPPWSPDISLAEMDRNGVATSICSLVQPGVWLGDVQRSRTLARECN